MTDIYARIVECSPMGVCLVQNGKIKLMNASLARTLGYPPDQTSEISIKDLLPRSQLFRVMRNELKRLKGKIVTDRYSMEILNANQALMQIEVLFKTIETDEGLGTLAYLTHHPKTDSTGSLRRYQEIVDSLPEVVFEMDTRGNVTFANYSAYAFFGADETDYQKGINAMDYVVPSERERLINSIQALLQGNKTGASEYLIQKKNGVVFPAMIHSSPVYDEGKPMGLRGVILDITERKMMEERIINLSQRDSLTGLYNRTYFESKMRQLRHARNPIGIIVCDVDGLKLINDTMGHSYGDQLIISIANAINDNFRENAIIARIGGDEFAVILSDIDESAIRNLIERLQATITLLNGYHSNIPLSVSCGYSVSQEGCNDPDAIFKEADNNMYKEKLFHSQSNRSAIIQTLMKALEARDYITEGHADRLQTLVLQLAAKVGLPENKKNDLRIFSQFHDIGKVGIPDRILFKRGHLTKEERKEMNRHSEIGYRIAQSAPDLVHISDWILKHHEWWNGAGYPLGLKGENIPLECRILSIVDAFDAMTNDRPYRKAIPVNKALQEIQKYSAIQFDPKLVEKFMGIIGSQD